MQSNNYICSNICFDILRKRKSLTGYGAILIGDVWHDRTGNQSNRFENDSFCVWHVSSVLQTDKLARDLNFINFHLRHFLYVRSSNQIAQDLDEEIADRRMTTDDVFQREQRHIPSHFGLSVGLDVIYQAVHVIFLRYDRPPASQTIPDYVFLHELPNRVTPIGHSCHVTLMQWHQERHKVCGISLVHFIENLIKVLDHLAKGTMVEAKAS